MYVSFFVGRQARWMVVRSSLGAGWRERGRESEKERLELSVNQHHDPATNDANLLIDGSSCTYYYTLVITVLAIFSA